MKVYLFVCNETKHYNPFNIGLDSDWAREGGTGQILSSIMNVRGRTFWKSLPLPLRAEIKTT